MTLSIDSCRADEYPALLAALDETFVTTRGRTASLASRFPHALNAAHPTPIRCLREDDEILACLVIRPFTWVTPGGEWRGAMIGMVYTAPAARGRGLASKLLTATLAELAAEAIDFSVLWSGLGLYARLGWVRHDVGVLGTVILSSPMRPAPALAVQTSPLSLRMRPTDKVMRDALAMQAVPLPATCCELVEYGAAYALYGRDADTIYVYEVVGSAPEFSRLWPTLAHEAARIMINERANSTFYAWLSANAAVSWVPQQQTYWQMLSARAQSAPYAQWHIPYFDRI
ncbi:MAG: GNAT family N-acetyltransferase [Gammaproteobacteria bacterium]|nr:GNAT family N-acetyltransferase [Gammaproteobacteria bacterium]